MAIKYYNTPPYYDDFDQTKNYLRVLFRPGFAVQARELTQLQTSIQAQIDRFGSHVFKEGSQVLGAEVTVNNTYAYIKLASTVTVDGTTYSADTLINPPTGSPLLAAGTILTGLGAKTSNVGLTSPTGPTAKVLEAIPSTSSDPATLYVEYLTPDTVHNKYLIYGAAEILRFSTGVGTRFVQVGAAEIIPVGYGTKFSVTEGVFFTKGCFVYSPSASVILAKYNNRPSARMVYKVTESTVTQVEDVTLTDNALGTPNSAAPGAHRYAISLDLVTEKYDLIERSETNIIQVAIIKNGKLIRGATTAYAKLNDILAQRTYEESGDYTVKPFQINIRELYNDSENGGLYTATQILELHTELADEAAAIAYGKTRLAVGVEPSVAYVQGYRVELVDTQYVEVEKARDEGYINAASTVAPLGGYVNIVMTSTCGLPDINNFSTLRLQSSSGSGGTIIGYARARSLEYSGSSNVYRLYLFDVQMSYSSGLGRYYNFSETTHLYQAGTPVFSVAVSGTANINDVGNNTLVYKLPADAIQSLRTSDGLIDTLYYVKRKYDNRTTDASGIVTLSASSDEIFESTTASEWTAVTSTGQIATPVITGGGTSITLTFASYPNTAMYIIGPSRRNLREKIKKKTSADITFASGANLTSAKTPGAFTSLQVTDLFKIDGIYTSANDSSPANSTTLGQGALTDITDRYIVDNGQRDNFYDVARIQLKVGAVVPTGQVYVKYQYFAHQPGDYFTVDSYAGVDYEDIPAFNSARGLISLRDAIDFRPTKDITGLNFTGTASSTVSMVKPGSIVTCDIQYYVPRTDKLYVDKLGNFSVVKGVSSNNPLPPEDPSDAMVLYILKLGAYTFGPEHVVPVMVDNKRYTMRDIGKLERRISNVEYYTALSLLERDTAGLQIFDGANNSRYKNGFIVDSFHGHGIGAVTNPDYMCAVDRENGILRPAFYQDNVKLLIDMTKSSGIRKTGDLLTLDYVQTNEIEQPYASTAEFVNPFNFRNNAGQMFLSPSTDEWRETLRKPDVTIDQGGAYSTYQYMNDNNAGQTVWNDWNTTWSGTEKTDESKNTANPVWDAARFGYVAETTTTQTIRTTQTQTRTGYRTSYVPSVQTRSTGDRVVEMNVIPYIRSRKIYFKATGLKPNTRLHAFFDNINVNSYVRDEAQFLDYATRTDSSNYLDATQHPDIPADLYSDNDGTVVGSFVIPNTPTLKFKTGARVFRLTSSATNSLRVVATYAEAVYSANGMQDVVQNTVITTRSVNVVRTAVSENRTIVSSAPSSTTSTSFTPTLWNKSDYLPGGALNPTQQVPKDNATTIANTSTAASYNSGGSFNPINFSVPTPVGGFPTVTAAQPTTTTTQAAVANLEWTPPAAEPPAAKVISWPNDASVTNDTPTVTVVNQTSATNKKDYNDVEKTVQFNDEF